MALLAAVAVVTLMLCAARAASSSRSAAPMSLATYLEDKERGERGW